MTTQMQVTQPPEVSKRIVLIDNKGLYHIIGFTYKQPKTKLTWQFFLEDPPSEFSLIKSTPRSYIYREATS